MKKSRKQSEKCTGVVSRSLFGRPNRNTCMLYVVCDSVGFTYSEKGVYDVETDQPEYYAFFQREFLLPNDVDSVPNMPLLILLSNFEDMRFQISNVLRE